MILKLISQPISIMIVLSSVVSYCQVNAGQISVINPSAGSEITGISTGSPQTTMSQSDNAGTNINGVSLDRGLALGSRKAHKIKKYFESLNYEIFSPGELNLLKAAINESLLNEKLDTFRKELLKEQLSVINGFSD